MESFSSQLPKRGALWLQARLASLIKGDASCFLKTFAIYRHLPYSPRVILIRVGSDVWVPYPLSRLQIITLVSECPQERASVFDAVARAIRHLAFGKSTQLELWKIACHAESELEFDDEAFYRNAIPSLGCSSGHALFISGTPAVILPGEASTAWRLKYLEKMLSVYGRGTTINSATYVTNFERVARHPHRYEETSRWREYTRTTADLIESPVFDIATSSHLRWAPSGYIDNDLAVPVLKYPDDLRQEDTMAVLTVRGKYARHVNPSLTVILYSFVYSITWIGKKRRKALQARNFR